MDKSWVIFLLVGVVGWLWFRSSAGVSSEQVKDFLGNSPQLVDVRTAGEFRGGSAEGAINIPLNELEKRLDEWGTTPPIWPNRRSTSFTERTFVMREIEAIPPPK